MFRIATFPSDEFDRLDCGIEDIRPRPSCTHPGATAEILFSALQYMRVNYRLISFASTSDIGEFDNITNTWSGAAQLMFDGKMDTMAVNWIQTSLRRKYFDFSYTIVEIAPVFVTKLVDISIHTRAGGLLLNIFSFWLWFTLLMTVVVLRFTTRLFQHFKLNSKAVNGLLLISAFSFVLFSNLFKGRLLAELLGSTEPQRIQDYETILSDVNDKKLTIVRPHADDWFAENLMYSKTSYFVQFRKAIAANPIIFEQNHSIIEEMVSTGEYVAWIADIEAPLIRKYNCELTIVRGTDLPVYQGGFVFVPGSPWMEKFNDALIFNQQHTEHIITKYIKNGAPRCPDSGVEIKEKVGKQALNLNSLSWATLTFSFGCALGVIFLAAECCLKRTNWQPKRKRTGDSEAGLWHYPKKLKTVAFCSYKGGEFHCFVNLTTYYCSGCHVPLCIECFLPYHKKLL